MIHYKRILLFLLLLGLCLPVYAELRVKVSANRISLQDSLQLTIESTNGDPSDIDVSPISLFFDIVQQSTSSSFNITNGSISSNKSRQMLLLPKQVGQINIPSFELAGDISQPIKITVTKANTNKQLSANDPARIELSADSTSIRVQQQIIIILRLYYQGDVFIDGRLADISPSDSIIKKISEKSYQENSNGIFWQVLERRYAVYPQKSGDLTIVPVRFDGTIKDTRRLGFFRQGRPYRTISNSMKIDVQAPAYTDKPWLPANNLTVKSQLDQQQLRVGEPVTRIIEFKARGQVGEQLPEIPLINEPGVQTYQDKSEINSQITSHGIDGIRTETIVIIPEQAGELRIAEQQISWWDNSAKRRRELTIPGHSLTVLPALYGNDETQVQVASSKQKLQITVQPESSEVFGWTNIVLLVLLVASMLGNLLLWRRKSGLVLTSDIAKSDDEQLAFTKFCDQLPTVSARGWQKLINHWLEHIGEQHCLSTRRLISLLDKHCKAEEKQQLERLRQQFDIWLYSHGDKPDMEFFLTLCKRLRKDHGYPKSYAVPGFSLDT